LAPIGQGTGIDVPRPLVGKPAIRHAQSAESEDWSPQAGVQPPDVGANDGDRARPKSVPSASKNPMDTKQHRAGVLDWVVGVRLGVDVEGLGGDFGREPGPGDNG
jgi:hypothetical protein